MSSRQSTSRRRKRASRSTSNPSRSTSKPQTTATRVTTTTKNTSPYDRAFQQNLTDHGIYPEEYEYPDGRIPALPDNWEDINHRLVQPRPSLSPSQFCDGAFKKFKRAHAHARKEHQVRISVIPTIEGEAEGRRVGGGLRLTNLDHLTDGTITYGTPDIFYGARPEQLDRRIRKELSGRIVPSTQEDLPMAPNFFLAVKGPDGSSAIAERQACYDGALGARGIQSLQSYGETEPVFDNSAYTITSIYHGGQLKMYTTHPTQPTGPENRPEYFMNQLGAFAMTNKPETFREGATAFRNARDWAKEKRDEFIENANRRMPNTYAEPQSLESSGDGEGSASTSGPIMMESDTSADELTLEKEYMYTSFSKRPRTELPKLNRKQGGRGQHSKRAGFKHTEISLM